MLNLFTPIGKLPLVGQSYEKKLLKLGISTVYDLLHHIPSRYLDFTNVKKIKDIKSDEIVTIRAKVINIKNTFTKNNKRIQEGTISDETGQLTVVWFNQFYIGKILKPDTQISLAGKVSWWGRKIAIISPQYEIIKEDLKELHTQGFVPVYPETAGLSSKWIRRRISDALSEITKDDLDDFLDSKTLENLKLENFKGSLKNIHGPKSILGAEKSKKRLSLNELLLLQITNLQNKIEWQKRNSSYNLEIKEKELGVFTDKLDFILTNSQQNAVSEILSDMTKNYPMNRLLEGDVGSGKTVVAAIAIYNAYLNGYESIVLAPTQILANQHYQTLQKFFSHMNIKVSLITSNKKDSKKSDNTNIYVGTHALLFKKDFENVALIVIDEQHKFGVLQRENLIKNTKTKEGLPHVLTMTATPIPRTVALTFYGDLDLTTLTEMPKGRQKITTWIVPTEKGEKAYKWIGEQIKENDSQAYVVCPLIEDSEKDTLLNVKAATSEVKRLQKLLPNIRFGVLHGRLSVNDKNKILNDFKERKIDILVATPVVEVGIDIPNATIMAIEAADHFGLAQLHQLRGRVGRGDKKSYCLLFSQSNSDKATTRMEALKTTVSGFELAEIDLKMRGPGEIFGARQHGIPELKIASWQDFDLIKESRKLAESAVKNPKEYKKLFEFIEKKRTVPN